MSGQAMTPRPLEPCPWCGPEWANRLEVQDVGDITFKVYCGHCQCLGPSAGLPDDAVRYWNESRPAEDSLRAELEAAKKRVGELEASISLQEHGKYGRLHLAGQIQDLRARIERAVKLLRSANPAWSENSKLYKEWENEREAVLAAEAGTGKEE